MSNWQQIRLGDVCSFQNGLAFKSNEFDTNGDYYVIKIKELKNGYVKLFDESSKVFKNGKNNIYSIKYNDVLIALTGDPVNKPNPCSWVGRVAVNKNKEQLYLNQRVAKFCPNDNFLDLKFIYYYFRVYDNFYDLAQKATGSASQANISTKTIEDTVIFVPSLNKQKQIVKILSSLDDKIELNNRINANLEEQAQALFRRWFVDFEFPNEEGLSYKSNGGKFAESEHGAIPEGWNLNPLNHFGKIVCGKTPSKSIENYFGGDIPFIKIPDMHNNIFVINSEDSLSSCGERSQSNKTIPPYSILVSCIATVGLVCMNTKRSQFNQQINAIIPFNESFRYYIYLKLKTMYNKLQLLASGGSATLNLNTSQFSAIKIENPNKKLIIDFNKITKPFFNEIELRQNENIYLTQLRDSLLPKLMNNQIEIH